jgi:hypothetical protein
MPAARLPRCAAGRAGEQPDCLRKVRNGMNNWKAVLPIQAQRAGTKDQPSPEGLGN